jgi:predicted CXXCH cytochrome family protein
VNRVSLSLWLVFTLLLSGYLGYVLFSSDDKSEFIVGEATYGHYQIEMSCGTCHTSAFGGEEVLQEACLTCHKEDLSEANDSHPIKKFTDPRNADRLEKLNATQCVTCHREHQNEQTHPMGVTLPEDFCFECHEDIAKDRPSHDGMEFDTCASAGCHNYHDNKALYEDFLVKHGDMSTPTNPPELMKFLIPNRIKSYQESGNTDINKITTASKPASLTNYENITEITHHWEQSSHAQVNVDCVDCHARENDLWQDNPPLTMCADCHKEKWQQFSESHHGMRQSDKLASPLSPMTPKEARLPFNEKALLSAVTCQSCHGSHQEDLDFASTKACLSCHSDEHSRNFNNSKHATLQLPNTEQHTTSQNTTMTCASCHMPRYDDEGVTRAMHNPNHNLRPNEKMIRTVCMDCHSLAFSIDALADKSLIKRNFVGKPSAHISSIDMAVKRTKN